MCYVSVARVIEEVNYSPDRGLRELFNNVRGHNSASPSSTPVDTLLKQKNWAYFIKAILNCLV